MFSLIALKPVLTVLQCKHDDEVLQSSLHSKLQRSSVRVIANSYVGARYSLTRQYSMGMYKC